MSDVYGLSDSGCLVGTICCVTVIRHTSVFGHTSTVSSWNLVLLCPKLLHLGTFLCVEVYIQGGPFYWLHQNLAISHDLDTWKFSMCLIL